MRQGETKSIAETVRSVLLAASLAGATVLAACTSPEVSPPTTTSSIEVKPHRPSIDDVYGPDTTKKPTIDDVYGPDTTQKKPTIDDVYGPDTIPAARQR